MFKEFGLLGGSFLIILLVFRRMYGKNRHLFQIVLAGMLCITVIVNIIYNFKYVYPEFVYEGIAIGDSRENLFAYKDDSEFQWQILFPLLKGRTVYMDDSDLYYKQFLELYAEEVIAVTVDKAEKDMVVDIVMDSAEPMTLSMVELLNYAFEPRDSSLFEDRYPSLRILETELKGSMELVAVIDNKSNLYILTKEYFDTLRRHGEAL